MKELDLSNSWGEWASTVPASLSLQFDKDIKQLWWEDIKQCGEKTEVQRTMRIYKGKYQKHTTTQCQWGNSNTVLVEEEVGITTLRSN